MKKDKIKNNMKKIQNKTEKKRRSTRNRKDKTKEKTNNRESINKLRIYNEKVSFQKILLFYLMKHHLQMLSNGLKLIKLQLNLIRLR